jgi:diaminohydroxyphosphoribosylaminopyrimidine deaminase/5-amino-6-(5-phosphoribosylamino)uracil reductase
MSDLDEKFMSLALRVAAKGKGTTSPNPRVGAVVVKDGVVVGKGWHRAPGEAHAEVAALNHAGRAASGSTLYVTLEPCCTWGRTGPCTDKIIASGVKRVVVGAIDPWPAHRGRGLRILRKNDVQVTRSTLRAEAERLNEGFNKRVTTGLPFVTVKVALSLDGKIATSSGESKWISNELSRQHAHRMRSESDAIIIGIGTVKRDDPSLTVRLGGRREKTEKADGPWRVVVDSRASINLNCKLLSLSLAPRTIIATTKHAPPRKLRNISSVGGQILVCRERERRVSLRDLMRKLARRGILYVLVEGGSGIITSALEAGVVDKVAFFYAPTLIGGTAAPSVVAGRGTTRLKNAVAIKDISIRRFGSDILVEGYVNVNNRRF